MICQVIKAEFTRPATTPTYASGQQVSDGVAAMQFVGAVRYPGMSSRLMKAVIVKQGTVITGATFDLLLFNTAPAAPADTTAFVLTYANRDNLAAVISFPAMQAASGCAFAEFVPTSQTIPVASAGSSRDVWGVLVAKGAYVGETGTQFSVRLYFEPENQD